MLSVWTGLGLWVASLGDLSWALPRPLVTSFHRSPAEIQQVMRAAIPHFKICHEAGLRS